MSAGQDIDYASATSLLDLYRKKALSPVEATRLLLDCLDRLQPKLNAFCIVDGDGALAAAQESERRWHRGEAARRRPGYDQGFDADARLPDDARVASRRSRSELVGGRACRRAPAWGGCRY